MLAQLKESYFFYTNLLCKFRGRKYFGKCFDLTLAFFYLSFKMMIGFAFSPFFSFFFLWCSFFSILDWRRTFFSLCLCGNCIWGLVRCMSRKMDGARLNAASGGMHAGAGTDFVTLLLSRSQTNIFSPLKGWSKVESVLAAPNSNTLYVVPRSLRNEIHVAARGKWTL